MVVIAWFSDAQGQDPVRRGSWTVGGNVRFHRIRDLTNDTNQLELEVAPQAGMFVVHGLAVSVNTRFRWNRGLDSLGGSQITFGFGPGITYYVSGLSNRFFPYGALRVYHAHSHLKGNEENPDRFTQDAGQWQWVAAVGGALFISHGVALVGELYYSRYSLKIRTEDEVSTTEHRNRSADLGLQLGLRVFVY